MKSDMINKKIILDRIKGCLYTVALSDAITYLKATTGKNYNSAFRYNPDYKDKPVPEQYLKFYEGKNITDKYIFVGFDGRAKMQPSRTMRATLNCMRALLMWKDDLQKTGIYVDPSDYINCAIESSQWENYFSGPFEQRIIWSPTIAVGVLGSWLFDFSDNINHDIKVTASNPLFNLHLSDDEEENSQEILKERTKAGIFAAIIRNLIISNEPVDVAHYIAIVCECALREDWGDERWRELIGKEALAMDLKHYTTKLFEWGCCGSIESGAPFVGLFLDGGILYSATLGSVNGFESFPYKDQLQYVEIMSEIEDLMANIERLLSGE